MKLPSTREEFTHFALKNSGSREFYEWLFRAIFNHDSDSIEVFLRRIERGRQIESWCELVYRDFPDIVTYEKDEQNVKIYFAGVLVTTLESCKNFSVELPRKIIFHYKRTCGEWLE